MPASEYPLEELPDASTFLSSRWSLDNLLTPYPPLRYNGVVQQQIDMEALRVLLVEAAALFGPLEPEDAYQGVFTWDVACSTPRGRACLKVPRAWDEPSQHGRCQRTLGQEGDRIARRFHQQGLVRYLEPALATTTSGGGLSLALYEADPSECALTFGRGRLQVNVFDPADPWVFSFSSKKTAEVLTEVIAAICYHYDPEADGGTALCDFYFGDGDFAVVRSRGGDWSLRMRPPRYVQSGVPVDRMLFDLIQMTAYEDFSAGGKLLGLPTLMSDPSVVFHGFVRGARLRAEDMGNSPRLAESEAVQRIESFSHSRLGHCYRPWTERFLVGNLPPRFGHDLRHRWWHLHSLREKIAWEHLRTSNVERPKEPECRAKPSTQLRAYRELLSCLRSCIGLRDQRQPRALHLNECTRKQYETATLPEAEEGEAKARRIVTFDELTTTLPTRSNQVLLKTVPAAQTLFDAGFTPSLGHPVSEEQEGTLFSLRKLHTSSGPRRGLANHELIGARLLPQSLQAAAVQRFASFQSFMDQALFDPELGYYQKTVRIGPKGHFTTHPERFSPHYGRWVAKCAFLAFSNMNREGWLPEGAPFSLIEWGGGTGRLARDVLDAIYRPSGPVPSGWEEFARCVRFTIYEQSEKLRLQQRSLVGGEATVREGDARTPEECLDRDFPDSVRGFVFSNELPDAFGVHKVLLDDVGNAHTALVVPFLEQAAFEKCSTALRTAIESSDRWYRDLFEEKKTRGVLFMDRTSYTRLLQEAYGGDEEERFFVLSRLHCRELYVSADHFGDLRGHFSSNAPDYRAALARKPSRVVLYVNTHAERFVTEVGKRLRDGYLMTVDYGDSTQGLIEKAQEGGFAFRVYRDSSGSDPTPNDPYAFPGSVDLTADVNFTALRHAGESAGLHEVHYGHERDLIGDELPSLVERNDPEYFSLLTAPIFKVQILATQPGPLLRSADDGAPD